MPSISESSVIVARKCAPTWQTIAEEYRCAAKAKIPKSWRLSQEIISSVSPTSTQSLIDIPRTCGILSEEELAITENYDAVALLKKLAAGKITSYSVTLAFCKRAAIAQQLTACITETMFDLALERAAYCDEYLARERKTLGSFHGLPISVKESFSIKGVKNTIGYISFVDHPAASHDSALIEILLSQGAVLYVKTNIPQTMMTADSHNNLFGRTLNPHNPSLTAGGSSGGEGALLAMKGSILGVGTDIAGSVRIPAYCNGVIGFKPSARRIPYGGQTSGGRPGSFGILPSAGPVARSVRDIEYFMRNVLSYDAWNLDESVISAPWRYISPLESQPSTQLNGSSPKCNLRSPRFLKLGILPEDPSYPLHPTTLRTIQLALSKLAAAGHTLIPLDAHIPNTTVSTAAATAFTIFAMDPLKTSLSHLVATSEPIVPSIPATQLSELKYFTPSLDDVFRLNIETRTVGSIMRKAFVESGLDAIIAPVYQGTAVSHDQYGVPAYTVLANLVDYPACSLPFEKADKVLDAEFVRNVSYVPAYVPDLVENAPCGIQLIGRYMRDEELVYSMGIVDDVLKA